MMTATDTRKEARQCLKGKWMKGVLITLLYSLVEFLFNLVIQYTNNSAPLASSIISIINTIISVPLSFGLTVSFMKLKRGEDISYTDFFKIGFNSFKKAWSLWYRMFLKLLLPIVCVIISTILLLVGIAYSYQSTFYEEATDDSYSYSLYDDDYLYDDEIEDLSDSDLYDEEDADDISILDDFDLSDSSSVLIILSVILLFISSIYLYVKSLSVVLTYNIGYDEDNLSSKEVVLKSQSLMNGNKGNYFVLTLSFIGWAILSAFTFGIGFLWLLPYIQVSVVCFYDAISGNDTKKETIIDNNNNPIIE